MSNTTVINRLYDFLFLLFTFEATESWMLFDTLRHRDTNQIKGKSTKPEPTLAMTQRAAPTWESVCTCTVRELVV